MIEAEWTLLPGFTIGTLIAIAGVAGTFAVMKSRTDDIPKWRDSVSDELKEIKQSQDEKFEKMEQREDKRREDQERHHAENRTEMGKMRDSVTALSIAVGFIKEEHDATRQRGRGKDRDRE